MCLQAHSSCARQQQLVYRPLHDLCKTSLSKLNHITFMNGVTSRRCKVAVIGAGASGLVAARELRKEGHDVVVFEQLDQLGGTWLYTEEVESDPLGRERCRTHVHSSMYAGLTTNIPREIMGFSDFPFSPAMMGGSSIDGRRFPCSDEVLRYLKAFADHYHLLELVRFNAHVMTVAPVPSQASTPPAAKPAKRTNRASHSAASSSGQHSVAQQSTSPDVPWKRWNVTWLGPREFTGFGIHCPGPVPSVFTGSQAANSGAGDNWMQYETFDAVLVCNGHYTEPHLPVIPGGKDFPGLLMHSHNYRRADPFKGQHVAVIGASYSGLDIARLVAQQAAVVYVCAREWRTPGDLEGPAVRGYANTLRRGMISRLKRTGAAEFHVGESVPKLDAVICCTGYEYAFPFLDVKTPGLSTRQQHVSPLYQHMFPPGHAPGLAFIGLPWRVVPFPMFELQAKLCARILSGRSSLPPADVMMDAVHQHAAQLAAAGFKPQQSHFLDDRQREYHTWLAAQCGPDVSTLPNWRAVVLHGYWLLRRICVLIARFRRSAAWGAETPSRC